ncbi:MAG: hypothetical protein IJ079_08360 [Lachnospiraceae bacterium]|nr:hypothetical protein [Lachnospiraceae bacterium]
MIDNMKSQNKKDIIFRCLVAVLFLLFFAHAIGLDKDLPNFGLGLYMSRDEGQYSQMAIKLYNNGSLYEANGIPVTTSPTFRSNILGNALQYLSLLVLGDNYYGFRLPYFLFSFLIMFFTYKTILVWSEQNDYPVQYTRGFIIAMLIYFNISFPFLLMSRVVENSSLRALVYIVFLYLWLKLKNRNKLKYFVLGLFSIISILFVYFSNITLLVTLGLFTIYKVVYSIRKKKPVFDFIFYTFLGILTGNIICEAYYLLIWKSEAWTNFFESIFSYSKRIVVGTDASDSTSILINLKNILKAIMTFFASNIFFFSISLCILFLVALAINVLSLKEYNETLFIITVMQIMFGLQCAATNDYTVRKTITILPIIILNIYIMLKKVYCNEMTKISRIVALCLFYFMTPSCIVAMIWQKNSSDYYKDFKWFDLKLWFVLIILESVMIFLIPLFMKYNKQMLLLIGMLFLICNLYYDIKYVYAYDSYTEKDAMIGMGKIVNDELVAGSYANGYTLYNDIHPVMNWDTLYTEEIADGTIKYFCDYATGPTWVKGMTADDFVVVQSFDRALLSWGKELKIVIFEKKCE